MRYLIIARHGHHDEGKLTELGRLKVKELAKAIKEQIEDRQVLILSSIATRARQSAEILARTFSTAYKSDETLFSDAGHPEDLGAALKLIKDHMDRAEALIIVTHFEYTEYLPGYFAAHVLGANLPSEPAEQGKAWLLDCETKTLTSLP